jgi:hypothetical protein
MERAAGQTTVTETTAGEPAGAGPVAREMPAAGDEGLPEASAAAPGGTTAPGSTTVPESAARPDGTTDAGTTDAGTTSGGTTDAGTTDAGTTSGGTTDAGTTDAGSMSGGSVAGAEGQPGAGAAPPQTSGRRSLFRFGQASSTPAAPAEAEQAAKPATSFWDSVFGPRTPAGGGEPSAEQPSSSSEPPATQPGETSEPDEEPQFDRFRSSPTPPEDE